MTGTYWIDHPRDFANEYTVAVASGPEATARYAREGRWQRITRAAALRRIAYRGDAATQAYVVCEYDGRQWVGARTELLAVIRGQSTDIRLGDTRIDYGRTDAELDAERHAEWLAEMAAADVYDA